MQLGIEVLVALVAALAVALLASRLSRAPLRSALLVGAVAAVASWSSPAVMIAGEGPLLPALLRAAAPPLVVLLLAGRPR